MIASRSSRVAMPEVGAGEVLVRVSRTALCGSISASAQGAEFTAGHEIFGVVEQPGHAMHGRRCAVYIPCIAIAARHASAAIPRLCLESPA